ncbi:MAG: diguanylate cyclase [Myxococcales bacterium]
MVYDRQRVLIVDDAPTNIRVLAAALQDEYRVTFATNGPDALAVALRTPPDLILLDIIMPDMNGFELCKLLKSDPVLSEIPVIFITSMSDEEDETVGLELGAVDYITKPFKIPVVRLRVRNQLALKRQRDLLARLTLVDGLTGIANRRAFDDALEREWRRGARTGLALSLIMIDVDHFKAFNDAHGHLAGDDCLRAVAGCAAVAARRAGDVAARWGGEEFVVLLPNIDAEEALSLAEMIRSSAEALGIPHGGSNASSLGTVGTVGPVVTVWTVVTVSLGVATLVPDRDESPTCLVERADRLLYASKCGGRNRVTSSLES